MQAIKEVIGQWADRVLGFLKPETTLLVEEIVRLMKVQPGSFAMRMTHGEGAPVVRISLNSELCVQTPNLGSEICLEKDRVYLATPYDGVYQLNRREKVMVIAAVNEWIGIEA